MAASQSSVSHVSWGSIELLHNVVRLLSRLNEDGAPFPVVRYRAKVKLHGSNCAVQVTPDGVFAQSRTTMLTPESDYKGFAAWVRAHEPYFQSLRPGSVVFGEWCGPGVERGMAVSALPRKLFAVFAVREGDRILYEPDEVRARVPAAGAPEDLFVLPWEGDDIVIDYGSRAALDAVVDALNPRVAEVEREDPWVRRSFGVSGLGEGLVFYPVFDPVLEPVPAADGASAALDPERLAALMFKAKGEKHRTAGTKTAVQVDASAVGSVAEFVALMVTEARLQQGLTAACGGAFDPRHTGKLLAWVAADVRKESVAELEASGLTWAQVEKAVQTRTREWFIARRPTA